MKKLAGWGAAVIAALVLQVHAAEIAFTGGEGGTGTDLSVAANWEGGALPGDGDTGVVDYSTFSGGGALTVGSNLALGGFRIRNASAALTLSGAGTLSLGAAGLGVDNTTALSLKLPIVVTAASTWPFGKGALNLYSTISGTATLGISEAGLCCVYAALGYDGDLTINSQGLRFYAAGKMAKTLKSTGATSDTASSYVNPSVGGEIRWSDVFTGGKFEYTTWRRLYVATTNGATECAHIVMDDPHDEFYQNGPYRSGVASGIFEQRDGYVHSQGPQYGITVGSWEVGTGQVLNNGRFPVEYRLSGGSNDVAYVFLGENAKYFNNNPVLKQSGGLSKVRKGVYIGAATDSSDMGFGEYLLSGGQLYVSDGTGAKDSGSDHQTRGIVLCHPFGGAGSCPGVFTQTGGTNTPLNVRFGPDTKEWNGSPPQSITAGFGLFDLKGGVVNFASSTTPFAFGKGWNQGSTNSTYRVNVSGGTMNFKDGQTISAQIEMPPSETASEWAVASGTTTVDAPVSGYGTLKKTGTGNLILNNMNRFGGTLKVAEGMVKMSAEPEDDSAFDDESDTCWIWTGDSFNKTHTNGQDVASWADDRHGVTAVDWTQAGTVFYAEWLKDPTFSQGGKTGLIKGYPKHLPVLVKNDDFNGHSAVRFQNTILQVPAAANPLAGSTNFTVALVYRQNNGGSDDPWYGLPIFGGTEYDWGGMDTMVVSMDASNRMRLNTVYQKDGKTRTIESISSRSGKSLKSKTCVVVCTFNGNDYSMNVNGYSTNAVLTSSTVRSLFKTSGRNLPLNFGAHFPDSANFSSSDTLFAEVRVYRDQSLTAPQVALLTHKLMKKYVGEAGMTEFTNELNTGLPGSFGGEAAAAAPKATDYEWTADAANALADGAQVSSLEAVGGGKAATTEQAGSATGPTLVKNAYNGHSALRFSSADKTALGIAAADIPVVRQDYAIAVVFATKTDAPEEANAVLGKSSGTGIVVQDLVNSGCHLGFTLHREGTLLAGYAYSWFINRRPFRLDDGMPHVAVFTRDATGNYVYMVDGRTYSGTTTDTNANGNMRMLLGKLATGQDTGYFDGDILAVRMYGSKLTVEEAKAISEHYAQAYGFRLLPYLKTAENVANNGFGRVALEVEAEGTLVLPYSQTNPFTIAEGRSLKGAGKVMGSVRYAAGGVLDLEEDLPWIEDLQFTDGMVLKTGSGASLPVDASRVKSVSGTITIDVSGLPADGPARTPVLTGLDERVIADGATFAVVGTDNPNVEVTLKDGVLSVARHRGLILLLK